MKSLRIMCSLVFSQNCDVKRLLSISDYSQTKYSLKNNLSSHICSMLQKHCFYGVLIFTNTLLFYILIQVNIHVKRCIRLFSWLHLDCPAIYIFKKMSCFICFCVRHCCFILTLTVLLEALRHPC